MKQLYKLLLWVAIAATALPAAAYDFMVDGICYNKNSDGKSVTVTYQTDSYPRYTNAYGSLSIPSSVNYDGKTYNVTAIGESAFVSCTGFTGSLTIPNSVVSIGEKAFSGCSGFTGSLTIPESVTVIGVSAFNGCSGFNKLVFNAINCADFSSSPFAGFAATELVIGNNVQRIPAYLLNKCSSVSGSLAIPNSVAAIGNYAFSGCGFSGSLTIPNSVINIGAGAFSDCKLLWGELTIPNSVTTIGRSAFQGCSGFTNSLTISESVTYIGSYAFLNSGFAGTLTIPSTVTYIGENAFGNCKNFSLIKNYINSPAEVRLGNNVFYNVPKNKCILSVRKGRKSQYSNADQWKEFVNITEFNWPLVASITLNKTETEILVGFSETLTAKVAPSDASTPTLKWTSSNASVASVDQNGKVTGKALGTAVITAAATDGSKVTATCVITVVQPVTSISFDQTELSIPLGNSETLTATVLPSNAANKKLRWSTSNTTVVTVDQNGTITPKDVGSAVITAAATDGSGVSASCNVTVYRAVQSITLNKTATEIYVGGSETLAATIAPSNATNKTLQWTSSNTGIATVDQNGKVTANKIGTATITAAATDGSGVQATCTVTVKGITSITLNKTTTEIYVGGNETLTATITPDDVVIKTLQWTSSNTSVATVDQNGKVAAKKLGSAVITATATDGSGVQATCTVTVKGITSITLNKTSTNIFSGASETLKATITPSDVIIKTLQWTSSNPDVATVDQNGKVTANLVGTAVITATATDGSGKKASCTVNVKGVTAINLDKSSISLFAGQKDTIGVELLPTNVVNRYVFWSSSKTSVATVTAGGVVTAKAVGTALITVEAADGSGVKATCTVTVLPDYQLTLPDIKHVRGMSADTVDMAVNMDNRKEITGMQFNLVLPAGVSLVMRDGLPDVWLDDDRKGRNHSVDVSENDNGSFLMLVSSPTNRPFSGNNGTVLHFNAVVEQYHGHGEQPVSLTQVVLTEPDKTEHNLGSVWSTARLCYVLGDANADVSVDVADYTTTALHILKRPTIRFWHDAANVINPTDTTINVTDLVAITNIGLGIDPVEVKYAPATGHAQDARQDAQFAMSGAAGQGALVLEMESDRAIAGLQMDVTLPAGMTVTAAEAVGRAAGMPVAFATLDNGSVRLLMSEYSGRDLPAGSGEVLRLTLNGDTGRHGHDDDISLGGITLCERDLNEHYIEPLHIALGTTPVEDLCAYDDVRIWAENGCIVVESGLAGTAQLVRPNGIATPLKVQIGRNVYPIAVPGIYIVRMGTRTAKLAL